MKRGVDPWLAGWGGWEICLIKGGVSVCALIILAYFYVADFLTKFVSTEKFSWCRETMGIAALVQ